MEAQDIQSSIDDEYAALNGGSQAAWTDARTDGPPHLLTASNILAINTFLVDLIAAISEHSQYPVVQDACVRQVMQS